MRRILIVRLTKQAGVYRYNPSRVKADTRCFHPFFVLNPSFMHQLNHPEQTNASHVTLTPTQADYLEMIYEEVLANKTARGCSIAQSAGVTRATVVSTFRSLKALGLINYVPYGPIELTDAGRATGQKLSAARETLKTFFRDVLQMNEASARSAAVRHKHAADPDMLASLSLLTDFITKHRAEWLAYLSHATKE